MVADVGVHTGDDRIDLFVSQACANFNLPNPPDQVDGIGWLAAVVK